MAVDGWRRPPLAGRESISQVLDVSVRAEPRIVCQIPAGMVGVLVDHDLIAAPVPALDDGVIVRGDVPVIITKPEAFPVSSRHHEYMLRSKATGEASVCPRLIEAEIPIVGATIMSDPLIVACLLYTSPSPRDG